MEKNSQLLGVHNQKEDHSKLSLMLDLEEPQLETESLVLLKVPVMEDFIFHITPDVSLVAQNLIKEEHVNMMLRFIEPESLVNMYKHGPILSGMKMMMVLNIKKDSENGTNVLMIMVLKKLQKFIKKFMKELDLNLIDS